MDRERVAARKGKASTSPPLPLHSCSTRSTSRGHSRPRPVSSSRGGGRLAAHLRCDDAKPVQSAGRETYRQVRQTTNVHPPRWVERKVWLGEAVAGVCPQRPRSAARAPKRRGGRAGTGTGAGASAGVRGRGAYGRGADAVPPKQRLVRRLLSVFLEARSGLYIERRTICFSVGRSAPHSPN